MSDRRQGTVAQCICGDDGRILEVDASYEELLGETSVRLRALDPMAFTHREDRARNLALLARLKSGRVPFEITKRYVRPDGAVIWVRNHVSAVRDGRGGDRLVATCRPLGEAQALDLRRRWRLARQAGAMLRAGRGAFGDAVVGNAASEMLLLLYLVEVEGRQITGDGLVAALGYPGGTARRWVRALAGQGLIEPEDGREVDGAVPLLLTRAAFVRMDALLADMLRDA